MSGARLRRLGVVRVSAGTLTGVHGVAMTLRDGGGIGWTLCGELQVPAVGRVAFESAPDPDYPITQVHGPSDAPPESLTRVLVALNLTDEDVLQTFE